MNDITAEKLIEEIKKIKSEIQPSLYQGPYAPFNPFNPQQNSNVVDLPISTANPKKCYE